MRLKNAYEIMEIERQSFAVPLDDNEDGAGCIVKLNKTAAEIFSMLQEGIDEEQIVERMYRSYGISGDRLASDVHFVIEELRSRGLLIDDADT